MSDLSVIIKTFERPESLRQTVESVQKHLPDVPILIADDSRKPQVVPGATVFPMPFDSGLSAGRNLLLSKVETKFFLLLDDDWLLTDSCRIPSMVEYLLLHQLDIVAGDLFWSKRNCRVPYNGMLERTDDGYLRWINGHHKKLGELFIYDIVDNFFVGRTASVSKVLWDEDLKVGEHEDFFFRAKETLSIGYLPSAFVINTEDGDDFYQRHRGRRDSYFSLFLKKHNLKGFINRHGILER